MHPKLRRHLRRTHKLSRRLARTLFHAMLYHGPKLDKQQVLLGRFVDIDTETFATSATVAHVSAKIRQGTALSQELLPKAD